ncbi:MAG: hypothetical protein HYZ89_03815 [Candidatus Omnitrophica bacterium]|nr:hypothetical protein [Candidatus Omnitrophota bacterium]
MPTQPWCRAKGWASVVAIAVAGGAVSVALAAQQPQQPAQTEKPPEQPPRDYAECLASPFRAGASELSCTYGVLERVSTEFVNCLAMQDRYRELRQFPCRFLQERRGLVLQCRKPGDVIYFPQLLPGPCELIYYNPDYVFPKNFEECHQRGGQLDKLDRGRWSCTVVIRMAPFYDNQNKAVVNQEFGKELIRRCEKLGGLGEMVATKYPECTLGFTALHPNIPDPTNRTFTDVPKEE